MQGLEFMVAHDPSDNGTKPDITGVWVIRKQVRRKRPGAEDEITPISSYYVVGENVYMAASLGNILGARLVRYSHGLQLASPAYEHSIAYHSILTEQHHCACIRPAIIHSRSWPYLSTPSTKDGRFGTEYADVTDKQGEHPYAGNPRFNFVQEIL